MGFGDGFGQEMGKQAAGGVTFIIFILVIAAMFKGCGG